MTPPVRLLALHWPFDIPLATVHRICGDRIVARGDNHQSLRADAVGKTHEDVIWMFLQQAEELLAGEVDEAVDMDIEAPLEDALARAVDACVRILDLPRPSAEQMGQALAAARGYAPKGTQAKQQEKGHEKKKRKAPRYYALLPEVDLQRVLDKRVEEEDVSEQGRMLYHHLKASGRVAERPHVTVVHEKGLPGDTDLWERCRRLFSTPTPPLFSFRLGDLVWNDQVMAMTVVDVAVSRGEKDPEARGGDFVASLPEELKGRLHVTIGTRSKDIPAVEARDMVMQWKTGAKSIESCKLNELWVNGRVKGLYN